MNKEQAQILAVLIDADNASPKSIGAVLAEIAKYGTANVKRVYGDWSKLNGWKQVILNNSLLPIQQFSYTKGKNATDSAMIIDAMDLLHSGRFGCFCLVTSDSDFTRLAARIREAGVVVYGFGENKTPKPFIAACNKFIYTEILLESKDKDVKKDKEVVEILLKAVDTVSDDDGWAHLGAVGIAINKQVPEFDSRNYGYLKLGQLVKAVGVFEIKTPGSQSMYIKAKERK
ncbi:MAG: NYN domain-containing protein [Gammaproteobacteria bacterium]|nr:NYN domain-containing protein [Gammaproteobacteria bacterium]